MKRRNLREVPEDVYSALAEAAASNRQSLSAYVVDRLTEAAQAARMKDYLETWEPTALTDVSIDDAVNAVRAVREVS